jgi:hypothetical protein
MTTNSFYTTFLERRHLRSRFVARNNPACYGTTTGRDRNDYRCCGTELLLSMFPQPKEAMALAY